MRRYEGNVSTLVGAFLLSLAGKDVMRREIDAIHK